MRLNAPYTTQVCRIGTGGRLSKMRRTSLLLATLTAIIAMGCSRALDASRSEWQKLESSALEKVQSGAYSEAEQQFELAIAKAELIADQEPLVKTLLELSDLHARSGHPEKSRHLLTRAHEIGEKQLKDPKITKSEFWQLSTARSALQLANTYRDQGDFPQAEAFYRLASQHVKVCTTSSAQDLASKIENDYRRMDTTRYTAETQIEEMLQSGRQAGDDARMRSNQEFNKLWKKSERLEHANSPDTEKLLLSVLEKAKATYGIRETKYRWTLQRLFTYYSRTHQLEKSRKLFEQDLEQLKPVESISKEKLESDPEYLADLHHLSITLSRLSDIAMCQDRTRDASEYTKRGILLRQKWGPRDLQYVYMLRSASEQLLILNRPAESANYLDESFRALDYIELHSGKFTTAVQTLRFHLRMFEAKLEYHQGSFKEAEKHLREIRHSFSKVFKSEPTLLALTLIASAELAHSMKKMDDEKTYLSELGRLWKEHATNDPIFLFQTHKQCGLFHLATMDFIAALADFERALLAANRSKVDNIIIDAHRWCAEAERSLERFNASEKHVLIALQRAELVKNWLAAIDAALCMGVYMSTTGQPEAAEPYLRKALNWCEQYYHYQAHPRWTALLTYADFKRKLGNVDIAFDTMKTALVVAEKNKSNRPDLRVLAYINFGGLCCDRGDLQEARKYFEKAKAIYDKESLVDHNLLFQLYTDWANSYWLERNDEKAKPLYSQALKEFRMTRNTASDMLLVKDTDIAFSRKLHRLYSKDGLTHQRLLKLAQLTSQLTKGNLSACSVKYLAVLCTLDNRLTDADIIDKIACETRDRKKQL